MKKLSPFLTLLILILSCSNNDQSIEKNNLVAEDLWGNPIKISEIISNEKPTVIVPISTANCGYCLIDGFYVEKNYLENNHSFGGSSFHQCLFNPQLDIYTFQKHYRWKFSILTYPPALHQLHMNGFPALLAFQNSKKVIEVFSNYTIMDSLSRQLWQNSRQVTPTGPFHMAMRFIFENKMQAAVRVYPNEVEIPDNIIKQQKKGKSYTAKNLNQLTERDLKKHLFFFGDFSFEEIARFFEGQDMRVKFKNGKVQVGNYGFDSDSTGMQLIYPNPFNRSKYLVMKIRQGNILKKPANYLDYIFFRTSGDSTTWLLYGHFDKSDSLHWKFSEGMAFSHLNKKLLCEGKCEIPQPRLPARRDTPAIRYSAVNDSFGQIYNFGSANCRFPDLITDPSGNVWASWEEDGDIHLAEITADDKIITRKIENTMADSYTPRLTFAGNKVWIFYLSRREHYYRLYARTFDGLRLSEEFLVSPQEPYDVITPAVVSGPGGKEITVAWSTWLANQRVLYYRRISGNIFSSIKRVDICDSKYIKDYFNAWYPSLSYDDAGNLWAAWNQHYPALYGVFGGKIDRKGTPITRSAKDMEDWEIGGYPCLFSDGERKYIVWEGDGWDSYRGKPQKIKFAAYDEKQEKWSLGEDISMEDQTFLNQTPYGIVGSDNTLWAVYSGRPKGKNTTWGIYLTYNKEGKWSAPVLVSPKDKNARAPKITVDKKDNLWLAWHSGIGLTMKITVLKADRKNFISE